MPIIIRIIYQLKKVLNAGVLTILMWSLLLNVAFGVAFYFAERGVQDITLLDAIWWSMVTMTTVGYGDFYAQTNIGRFLISYPCMILGIGIIGYLVGMVANWIIELASKKKKGEMDITFSDHIVICNFPGMEKLLTLTEELRCIPAYAKANLVLVTETLDELPERLVREKYHFVRGLPTDEEVLYRANITKCAGVIVLAEDPTNPRSDDRVYTIGSIIEGIEREKNVKIKTIVELVGNRSVRNLERAMVDGIVAEENLAGCLLAQEFMNPGVNRIISQLISNRVGSQLYIQETRMVGHPICDLQMGVLRHESNIQIIGIIQDDQQILNPPKQLTIKEGDRLIVLAERSQDLAAIEKDLVENPGKHTVPA